VFCDVLKCTICCNVPINPVKCKSCESIFCKDCPSFHRDPKLAYISGFQPCCGVCLSPVTEHSTLSLDRNLHSMLTEELKITCQFSEYKTCTMKQGSIDTILNKHQATCQACNDCKYKCTGTPQSPCECGKFYTRAEMEQHLQANHNRRVEQKQKEEIVR
jgi:hypothetical protein